MELDHIFIFTKDAEQVSIALRQFGLSEGSPNVHPGQGTACRRFFFHNAYLELVWVANEEEIKSAAIAKMKLWDRSQYRLTNYCPFGLCFRIDNQTNNGDDLIFDDGWQYSPAYLPSGQFINIASNESFPAEPLLFEMPFFRIAPRNIPLERQQPLTHEKGFQEITKVTLTLPGAIDNLSKSINQVIQNSIMAISTGEQYAVLLEFDYGIKGEIQNFNPLIPLTITW